ncbi:MAG TPA: hypothetical protein VNQ73_13030 [Ilumatobacter sp.]|nr:hypothetical protein [Ilumatobacter sp.]
MIRTTPTQLMGQLPVVARRRGPVAVHCTRPYAGTPNGNGNWVLASGFWVGSMDATTRTIKRPTRHLAPRTT